MAANPAEETDLLNLTDLNKLEVAFCLAGITFEMDHEDDGTKSLVVSVPDSDGRYVGFNFKNDHSFNTLF